MTNVKEEHQTKFINGSYANLEPFVLKKATMVMKALNHKLRRRMMEIIHKKGKITVTELFIELRTDQSIVSQHLAILRRAKIVTTVRDGKYIYYSINEKRIGELDELIGKITQ
jgi:DNA-binding transcriptional ArsR family regulator